MRIELGRSGSGVKWHQNWQIASNQGVAAKIGQKPLLATVVEGIYLLTLGHPPWFGEKIFQDWTKQRGWRHKFSKTGPTTVVLGINLPSLG
jgi:hypothetical protein